MSKSDTVITATLIRGKTYQYSPKADAGEPIETYKFERAVPQEVPEEIADYLDEQVHIMNSRDGNRIVEIERPYFKINYDAPRADLNRGEERARAKSRKRLRLVTADEADQVRPKRVKKTSSRIRKR